MTKANRNDEARANGSENAVIIDASAKCGLWNEDMRRELNENHLLKA